MKQIHNVMYVPGIKRNLISVSTITDNDLMHEHLALHFKFQAQCWSRPRKGL